MAFREGFPFMMIPLTLTLLCVAGGLSEPALGWASVFFCLVFIYVAGFFRDPVRPISKNTRDILSPADGTVIDVCEMEEVRFTGEKMRRVAIFLSVFDVHVNRMPVIGKIAATTYEEGEFLDARNGEVDLRNENRNWLIETENGPVVLRQIAGLIARRIVAWAKDGDDLERGDYLGMIRFGSRTDIYLPLDCEVVVEKGQALYGMSSVIARWK